MNRPMGTMATVACLLLSRGAFADEIVVSEVTITDPTSSQSQAAPAHVLTTYYQGDKVRVQNDVGGVTLYDLKAHAVYWLNTADKSYSLVPIGQLPPDDNHPQAAPHVESDIKIKAKNETRSLAGLDAINVEVAATGRTIHISGGGFGRHGGIHNGGRRATSTVTISGEYWLSDGLHVADKPNDKDVQLLPLFAETLVENRTVAGMLEELTKKMNQLHKGAPVASKLLIQRRTSDGDVASRLVTTELKTVTVHALDPGMFLPPADYRQSYPAR